MTRRLLRAGAPLPRRLPCATQADPPEYHFQACHTGQHAWAVGQKVVSPPPHTRLSADDLPSAFWWGNVSGTNYLTPTRQQHLPQYCGSCWAFATLTALSDRLKVARAGAWSEVVLSPQVVINCRGGGSCNGGDPTGVYEYMSTEGVPDETCQPYVAANGVCSPLGICDTCSPGRDGQPFLPGTCAPVSNFTRYSLDEYGDVGDVLALSNAFAMKAEIYARGPIACGISVTAKFESYTPSPEAPVFSQRRLLALPNHVIEVTGWGVLDDGVTEYWIARNSWGQSWAANGFINVKMHGDNLGIERTCTFGVPTLMPSHAPDDGLLRFTAEAPVPLGKVLAGGAPALAKPVPVGLPRAKLFSPEHPCLVRRPGGRTSHVTSPLPHTYLDAAALPKSYDIRNISGVNYASVTRNQHAPLYCGSCWAHSTASALSDRIALVRGNAVPEIVLAPQVLVDCVKENSRGCSGGDPNAAFEWLISNPMTDESCSPYLAKDDVCTPQTLCSDCSPLTGCSAKAPQLSFTVAEHGTAFGEHEMMTELAARGPVVCGMCVTDAFEDYTGGVLVDDTGCKSEMHAISIAGYGTDESGVPYWLGRNSWGTAWGEQGWFRLKRGVDTLGIEVRVSAPRDSCCRVLTPPRRVHSLFTRASAATGAR